MASASCSSLPPGPRLTPATVVEDLRQVDAPRGFRQVDESDARRVVAAIHGLKAGRVTAAQLLASIEAGTFRELLDAVPSAGATGRTAAG